MNNKLTRRTIHFSPFFTNLQRHFYEAKFTMVSSPRDKNRNEDINKTSYGCLCAFSSRCQDRMNLNHRNVLLNKKKMYPILFKRLIP